mgnify:FL=1
MKYLIANCVLGILMIEWALAKLRPLRPKNKKDRERDEKFPAFKRNDLDKINRIPLYLSSPFLIARFFIAWGSFALTSVFVFLISIFHKPGAPYKGF